MIYQRPWATTHNGRARSCVLRLGTVLLLGGCATYQPMPLTPQAVDRALAPPEMTTLAAQVTTLHNPLLHPVPVDLARGLTPDAAAILAVVGNPALRGERDRRALAAAQLLQAGVLPNPVLSVGSDVVTGGHTAGTFPGYLGSLSWDVTALLSQSTHTAAARATSEAVQLDVAWKEWQFAQAAQKAVYDLVALRAQLREAEAVDRRLADDVALLRAAVAAYQRTLIDLAAAEAASQQAHADVLAASRDLQHQQLVLNTALGLPSDTVVPVADDVVLPSRLALPPQEALLTGLEDRRLDLLALRRGYESQEQTLHAAVLAQFPKISLGFHQASDTSNVHTTGFGVSIDLPIFDRNQGHIALETATRQQLFDEYISRVFEARAAVAQSVADIQALTAQVAAAEAAIPALEQVVRTYRIALEQHNADVLSSYRAQNDLTQKRITVLKLQQQLMETMSALEIAAGVYLPLDTRGPARAAHLPTLEEQP